MSSRLRNIIITQSRCPGHYVSVSLSLVQTTCKYFLVSLYLLCTSGYHKLLTNNSWTVPVAFPFPKFDVAESWAGCSSVCPTSRARFKGDFKLLPRNVPRRPGGHDRSPLHGINQCLLRARKSTRMNLPLYSHRYSWWVCAQAGGIWDVLPGKGCPQRNAVTALSLGHSWSLSVCHLVFSNAMKKRASFSRRSVSAPGPNSPCVTAWGGGRP